MWIISAVISALTVLSANGAIAAEPTNLARQKGIEPQLLSDEERAAGFVSLFDGRTLDGWKVEDDHDRADWLIHDGAIYCTGERSKLEFTAKRLPRDFELRFRWRGIRPGFFQNDVDGNVVLYEHHGYKIEAEPESHRSGFYKEEGIIYGAAASRIGITTLPGKIIEPSPPPGLWESHGSTADFKLLRNAGEWNEGSIRCVGSRIECRLNGGEVFQYDAADPAASRWSDRKVAADWVTVKEAGFKLTVSCDNRPIWIRDIRLCDLTKPEAPKSK